MENKIDLTKVEGYDIDERNVAYEIINRENDKLQRRINFNALFGDVGDRVAIMKNLAFDYPKRVHIGDGFFANYNLTLNSNADITFGNNVMIGPNVTITTATHPLDPVGRVEQRQVISEPITIGDNVWIGANVTILPGVTLANNIVIAAGAVVTRSYSENSILLAGVPARRIKSIE